MTTHECGTRARYMADRCRCAECTEANRTYARMRYRIKMGYEEGPTVEAGATRRRLRELLRDGYSQRTISVAAELNRSTLQGLLGERNGRQRQTQRVTHEVARKIDEFDMLTVIEAQYGYIPAPQIWSLINGILATGMTKTELGQHLNGSGAKSLQVGKVRVQWNTAKAVCDLYSEVVGGNPYDVGQSKYGVVSSNSRLDDLLKDTLWGQWLSIDRIVNEFQERWGTDEVTVRRSLYRWLKTNEGICEVRYTYEIGSQQIRSIYLPSPY